MSVTFRTGVQDAIRVGLRLARPKSVWHFDHYDERPFSGVYASDLGRVQQTLEGILEHNPHLRDIAVSDERLRERNFVSDASRFYFASP